MTPFRISHPPRIAEVIQPTEFVNDLDLQARIVNSRMMHDYVSIMLVACLLLIIIVIA